VDLVIYFEWKTFSTQLRIIFNKFVKNTSKTKNKHLLEKMYKNMDLIVDNKVIDSKSQLKE